MTMPERNITSLQDAILTARKLSKDGHETHLDPCDRYDKACKLKDLSLRTLCKQEDGLIPEEGLIFCPLQKGRLQIVKT